MNSLLDIQDILTMKKPVSMIRDIYHRLIGQNPSDMTGEIQNSLKIQKLEKIIAEKDEIIGKMKMKQDSFEKVLQKEISQVIDEKENEIETLKSKIRDRDEEIKELIEE